jgi:hypothetical protein
MRFVRFVVCSLLLSFSLVAGAADLVNANVARQSLHTPIQDHGAFVVRSVNGEAVCNDATRAEALRINAPHRVPVHVFGEGSGRLRTNASAGLNIILRGTAQLDANPAAKAAFERAEEIWESRIANQITVYVDVDFGSTRFGTPFEEDVIASASSDYRDAIYSQIRSQLTAHADNASEIAIYAKLPAVSIPTDLGAVTAMGSPSIQMRALDLLSAVAQQSDDAPSIGFNSAFAYDFDPSNGIAPGQTDFEGVVVHEIGHMLGFVSLSGAVSQGLLTTPIPTVLDLFRFRPGVNSATFPSAQRIQSPGGDHVYFAGGSTFGLSTGQPNGQAGDERQASHWKDDALAGVRIGIMDPTISQGFRSQITDADLQAFGIVGYNIVAPNAGPAAPTNLTATGTSTTVIRLNWTDNSNNETEFVVSQKVGANFVDLSPPLAANTTQANVSPFTSGQSVTFRIRARNASGDSGFSNEATGTTLSNPGPCTPNSTTVCLLNSRFRVKIDYVNPFSSPPNQPGTFLADRLLPGVQNPDTALFGFSSAQAVEVVVRIQDTRPFAPRFDVYYGGMTDVGYTVTVTDTQTGTTRQYFNQVGRVGGGVDRNSFPASALGAPDRLITSGGTDSFPAEMEAVQPGDLVAVNAMMLANQSKTPVSIVETHTTSVLASKPAPNAGGGGACAEAEPNETLLLSDDLPLGTPCTGTATLGDSFDITVNYGVGVDPGKVQDVFKVTTGATGPLTATLTFTTASADLDVVGFRDTGSGLAGIGNSSNSGVTTETFTTAPLPAGTYYIGVSAYEGGSSYTLTVTGAGGAVPTAPSNLAASGTSTSVIRLTWNDNSNNETDFVVEQKVGVNFVPLNPPLTANTTAVNVGGFEPCTSGTFRVRARNASGDSPYSNEATGTTLAQPGQSCPCTPDSTTVCLLSNRFRVKIDYVNPFSNPPNQPGTFLAARLSTQTGINPDVALFGFSSATAVEVVVRVQDTRPFAPRFDVYYGGMTDVGYTVTVTDTQTGTTRQYSNTVGNVGGGVDRNSFPTN